MLKTLLTTALIGIYGVAVAMFASRGSDESSTAAIIAPILIAPVVAMLQALLSRRLAIDGRAHDWRNKVATLVVELSREATPPPPDLSEDKRFREFSDRWRVLHMSLPSSVSPVIKSTWKALEKALGDFTVHFDDVRSRRVKGPGNAVRSTDARELKEHATQLQSNLHGTVRNLEAALSAWDLN